MLWFCNQESFCVLHIAILTFYLVFELLHVNISVFSSLI